MTAEQLAALRAALQRELDLCERKQRALRSALKHDSADAPLPSGALAGVTFDAHGRGGCYGGAPRARESMLDGIWDCDSGIDTALDTGSEATDPAAAPASASAAAAGDVPMEVAGGGTEVHDGVGNGEAAKVAVGGAEAMELG